MEPTITGYDLHLFGEGRHHQLWRLLGAHRVVDDGGGGVSFAVWAPRARSVSVVGDFNGWDAGAGRLDLLGGPGVWQGFVAGVEPGARYGFELEVADGRRLRKADPFAFSAELPPGTASIVTAGAHRWGDADWMARRDAHAAAGGSARAPLSVYECHLGSWRRAPTGGGERPLTYLELAEQLPDYVAELGFTHVELMPVAEHPFGGSWGYQVTSYFAPTSRYGSPDDFRALVDAFHRRGLGVIVDWVPAHFPRDDWALARFDGQPLYEHPDPRRGEHPDWGTLVFDYGRPEVRNFLVANALYWIEEFHVDGLRVDAVASMLYLDYSRAEGGWEPNVHGGRENLEAVALLQELNEVVGARHPGVTVVAEESTAWPGVTDLTSHGGLGFGLKWNLGWMHDTLEYFSNDPLFRRHHQGQLTFGLAYAWSEHFVLPLSHDEVVHGKGTLLTRMPGDRGGQLANLRALLAWMWAHPGRQLLFMGAELAQEREWSHDRGLDWHLLDDPGHAGVQQLVRALNQTQRDEPALYELDFEPAGFQWLQGHDSDSDGDGDGDADHDVLAFLRLSSTGRVLACVANFSGADRPGYRVGLPATGAWRVVLTSAATGVGPADVVADDVGWHGRPASVVLDLPALTVLWLRPVAP